MSRARRGAVLLTCEQRVEVGREALWRFHNDPDNLARLLAAWKPFRMVSHEGHVRPGARLVVAERLWGLDQVLTFVHDVFEPPDPDHPGRPARFGERAVAGPFTTYVHVHEFHAEGDGASRVVDRVEVLLRARYGGAAVTRLVVAPRLRRFFACRHRALERLVRQGAL